MSTSLLYHAFGIRGYKYSRTQYDNGKVIFTIHQEPETYRCSSCGSRDVISEARLCAASGRSQSAVGRRSWCCPSHAWNVRRVGWCVRSMSRSPNRDGATRSPSRRYALELPRSMTIRDVARHLNVGWDLIKDIQKRDLSRRYAKPKLKHLRHIAIDEIAIAKGHRYLTLVMDLESGAVVFVGDGKGADALKPFWKRLRPSGAKIEAVAMDMSVAYRRRSRPICPRRRSSSITSMSSSSSTTSSPTSAASCTARRPTCMQKKVLKGTRWLLLKNPENLDEEKDEKRRLKEALKLNEPLATAYYLKDDLRRFWDQPGKRSRPLSSMAGFVERRRPGSRCSSRWPRRWRHIDRGCWPTTT